MQLFDAVTLGEPRLTRDGYLVADAKIARTGIQLYAGKEVDPENKQGWRDKALVRVYRPESEVFSTDAMASFAHKPITDDHPSEAVSSKNPLAWPRASPSTPRSFRAFAPSVRNPSWPRCRQNTCAACLRSEMTWT